MRVIPIRQTLTASLEDFERVASEEQQDWLRHVRERGHEATEVARTAISDHVAELIRYERQRQEDQEGRYDALSMAADTTRDFSSMQDCSSSSEKGANADDKPGKQCKMEEGEQSTALDQTALGMNKVAAAEGVNRGYADDDHNGGKFPQPQSQGVKRQQSVNQDGDSDVFLEPPSLGGCQVEAMAVLAAEEASCIRDIDTWVGDARRRELEMTSAWMTEAASGDLEEQEMAETELETLESEFLAARKDADEAVSSARCEGYSLRPSGVSGTGAAPIEMEKPANPEPYAAIASTRTATPGFFAEEEEECSALWSSLEWPLSSLKLALKTIPAGSDGLRRGEREGGEEEETRLAASRIITGLECELRAVVTDSFSSSGQVEEVRSMIRASSDELRAAFILIGEETQAKRKVRDLELVERARIEAEAQEAAELAYGEDNQSPPGTASEGRVTDGERRNDVVPANTWENTRKDCGALGGIGTE